MESDCFFLLCVLEKLRSNRQRDRRKNVFLRYFKFYDYYTLIDFLLGALKTFSFFFQLIDSSTCQKNTELNDTKATATTTTTKSLVTWILCFSVSGRAKGNSNSASLKPSHQSNECLYTAHFFAGFNFFFFGRLRRGKNERKQQRNVSWKRQLRGKRGSFKVAWKSGPKIY